MKSKYLIFTSAGDNSCVNLWIDKKSEYDIWVCYYGDSDFPYKSKIKYYTERKGGKFQNLFYCFNHYPGIFEQYDSFFIIDDDIVINHKGINHLFEMHRQLNLKLLQPSYDKTSKISHSITARKPLSQLRYTNFVEIGAPIIKYDALESFMKVYDPLVNCAGVDWWLCSFINKDKLDTKSIAICDSVWCLNPYDQDKPGDNIREIDKLETDDDRQRSWKVVKETYNLDYVIENQFITYKTVYSFSFYQVFSWGLSYPLDIFYRLLRKIKF